MAGDDYFEDSYSYLAWTKLLLTQSGSLVLGRSLLRGELVFWEGDFCENQQWWEGDVEDVAGGGMRQAALPEEEGAREAAAEGGAHRGLQKQLQKF